MIATMIYSPPDGRLMSGADRTFRKRYIGFILAPPRAGEDAGDAAGQTMAAVLTAARDDTWPVPSRGEVIGTIRSLWRAAGGDPEEPWAPFLTAYDGGSGIVRVGHIHRDRMLELLKAARAVQGRGGVHDLRFITVTTSGSIRKVKGKLGLPPDRKQRRT